MKQHHTSIKDIKASLVEVNSFSNLTYLNSANLPLKLFPPALFAHASVVVSNQAIWKILAKSKWLKIFPKVRGEHKKIFELPPPSSTMNSQDMAIEITQGWTITQCFPCFFFKTSHWGVELKQIAAKMQLFHLRIVATFRLNRRRLRFVAFFFSAKGHTP